MSEWRETIAAFNNPKGARIVIIDCPKIEKVLPHEVFRAMSDYVNPKATILVIGHIAVVSQYIACRPTLFKHAWHICTTGFETRQEAKEPTERVTMIAVFSELAEIKYSPLKVLHCMKMERNYPSNVVVVDEPVGIVPDDVRTLLITMYGGTNESTLCPFPKRNHAKG